MKRLFRGVFLLVLAVSTLSALTFTALWIRSYFICDLFDFERADAKMPVQIVVFETASVSGRFLFYLSTASGPPAWRSRIKPEQEWYFEHAPNKRDFNLPAIGHFLGFGLNWDYSRSANATKIASHTLELVSYFPFWAVVLLSVGVAGLSVKLLRRSAPAGLCRRCGYDLRASQVRCPECGAGFEIDKLKDPTAIVPADPPVRADETIADYDRW